LKQVFFNVVKNAMEAMAEGGRLRIVASSDDDFLYIKFYDTGSGIGEADLSRVFQPYFTTKSTGHGLGMMIVNRIMQEHGGQVGIESIEGEGTLITLQFPLQHRRSRLLVGD
jgi:signal transduction histidine kinase